MNIIEILWKLGWDILSFNEDGEYKIQLGHDRQLKDGYSQDKYLVRVNDVSFNGFGDLVVTFTEVGTGNCFDAYEYRNMDKEELFT